jgi:asparagine synthase (glutamine-hydrolysing)
MSGIAGWIASGGSAPDAAAVAPMLEALAHRGAGGEGAVEFAGRGGERRAVIGSRGGEPRCDAAAGVALAFDGSLDNRAELRAQLRLRGHHLADDSDAELALRAYQHWDRNLVKHLRGRFALAVWDERKERLLLARDRFGEKPLYLYEKDGALFFSSEVKALLKNEKVKTGVDLGSVWECLAYRYVPGPRTLFAGVRKLAPASMAVWQFGKLRESRYWSPPDKLPPVRQGRAPGRAQQAVEGFVACLDEAVKLQTGNGRCGVLLSGGLDSAVLVALAARHRAKLPTFSLGFAGDPQSELPQAAQVAQHFATEHQEIVVAPEDLFATMEWMVGLRDAPLALPSDLALLAAARAAARRCDAVLTGEGADEVLGGYGRHVAERFGWGLSGFTGTLGVIGAFNHKSDLRTASASLRLRDWRERCVRWVGTMSDGERKRFSTLKSGAAPNGHPPFDVDPRTSDLRRILYFEQSSWLPDNLLERSERAASANGIEARNPFVDHHVAEFVSALPDASRVHGTSTKWILRQAAQGLLPDALRERRKLGFRVPAGEWLRGDMREYLADHLKGAGSLTRRYYHAGALDRALDEHLKGRKNHDKLLWTLLNLEIWHRTYVRA